MSFLLYIKEEGRNGVKPVFLIFRKRSEIVLYSVFEGTKGGCNPETIMQNYHHCYICEEKSNTFS